MTLTTTGELVQRAADSGRAQLAFNVITLEHAEAIVAGAEAAAAPVILAVSQNAVGYHDGRLRPIAAAALELARGAAVDVAMHLDHVEDDGLLRQAADAGFSSVMFDAAALDYEQNVRATRAAADWAHDAGLWLEAELGYIGGKASQTGPARGDGTVGRTGTVGSAHSPGVRTDPAEAAAFVRATGVDALAVAVGSSHAMTTRSATLDHELIAALRAAVPVPLVLHGSSGVPDHELRRAVEAGMVKINIGTALNVAFTAAVRSAVDADRELVDPRRYLTGARQAMATTVLDLLVATAPDSP